MDHSRYLHVIECYGVCRKSFGFYLLILFMFVSLGCSIDASLISLNAIEDTTTNLNREEPDFIAGEVITSTNGYKATGVFSETSDRKTSSNGYQMEGVFYGQ
jgi:hypothetical protein